MGSTLGVQYTTYAPWQWHCQYIGNYGHGQQVDKNSPTEGTLALVKVQLMISWSSALFRGVKGESMCIIIQLAVRYFFFSGPWTSMGKGRIGLKQEAAWSIWKTILWEKIVKTESWRTRSTNSLLGIIFKYYQMQYYEVLIAREFRYYIKVLSSTNGHGVRYHIQVLSSAVLWSTNSWRVRCLSLPSLELPVRWRLPLICSDPPQDEILFD